MEQHWLVPQHDTVVERRAILTCCRARWWRRPPRRRVRAPRAPRASWRRAWARRRRTLATPAHLARRTTATPWRGRRSLRRFLGQYTLFNTNPVILPHIVVKYFVAFKLIIFYNLKLTQMPNEALNATHQLISIAVIVRVLIGAIFSNIILCHHWS